MERVDIAIIGTGPAGVSAAITSKVRNKNILLFGSTESSDKVSKAHEILNYPGLPNVAGAELADRFKEQLNSLNIQVTKEKVNAVYSMGEYFAIQTADMMYEATSVILATGIVLGKPFPKEEELLGSGVSYCATCDAMFYKGKEVAVIGYNEEAEEEAKYLSEVVGKVYYFSMKKNVPEFPDNIEVINEQPLEILGNKKVEGVKTRENVYTVDGVFILRDAVSPDQLVPGLELVDNHVKVNMQMETDIKGLFACGDIVGKPYQYIKAAGQGNVAALSAVGYLTELKNK